MTNTKLDAAKDERVAVEGKLGRIKTYVDEFRPNVESINQLKGRLKSLHDCEKEFEVAQTEIEKNDKTTPFAEHTKIRETFENKYFDLVAKINDIIDNQSKNASTSSSSSNNQIIKNDNNVPFNLPVLNLKTFNGCYKNWINFENGFKSIIEENKNLNKFQKFQYLKSCLQDEALRAVDSLAITEENYDEAWRILIGRFKNTRLIVQDHVYSILHAPVIGKASHTSLRELLDTITTNLTSLKLLGISVDTWDALLISIIEEKLDFVTKKEWQTSLDNNVPTQNQFMRFLEKRCSVLESLNSLSNNNFRSNNNFNANKQSSTNYRTKTVAHAATQNKSIICNFCKKSNHNIYQCTEFSQLSVAERSLKVQELRLCNNCLRNNHKVANCKSNSRCRDCNQKHNTLLHVNEAEITNLTLNNFAVKTIESSTTLLSTAVVLVKNVKNQFEECRALLDPGSMSNYVTQSFCKKLGFTPSKTNVEIRCLNGTSSSANERINLGIKSKINAFAAELDCLVVKNITENLPLTSINPQTLNIPRVHLADPLFFESGQVDLLIGAGLFLQLLCIGQIRTPNGLVFQKTHLGFIAGGNFNNETNKNFFRKTTCNLSLNDHLEQFWRLESMGITQNEDHKFTKEETACETIFQETTKQDPSGRFIVKLPFKSNEINIGDTKSMALKRWYSLERSLNKNSHKKEEYSKFMLEYENLGHMKSVSIIPENGVYLSHHAVINENSSTSRLRVVFDASMKSSNNISLNENLMAGPVIQQDLFSIVIRFRTFKYCLTADVTKMYRQILINQEDTNCQLIFWRSDQNQPLKTYKLETLTYGMKPSSFLATRCLKELAIQNDSTFPQASEIISRDFYMDDLLTGSNSIEELIKLRDEVIKILKQGQFELRKFHSNEQKIIPVDETEINDELNLQFDKNEVKKTLGLHWNPISDIFKYNVDLDAIPKKFTKRNILAMTARIFDPLGLIGPIIMKAKIILQKLWSLKIGWDESVPAEVHTTWYTFLSEIQNLQNITIPRKIIKFFPYKSIELHGFCDASQSGYGACIYIRVENDQNEFYTTLLCSKSRVAPLKKITLPRLELCGALLLTRLINKIKPVINIKFDREIMWTDSSIVLAWINNNSGTLKTFVSNRIIEIQSSTIAANWRHINSENNAADILSRGVFPHEFNKNNSWFTGPSFLQFPELSWPKSAVNNLHKLEEPSEILVAAVTVTDKTSEFISILEKFSTFIKLQRTFAFINRFVNNSKIKNKSDRKLGNLSSNELKDATITIFKLIQKTVFHSEIKNLEKGDPVHRQSKLLSLDPFLDKDGLIRVGGRLKNANIASDIKNPIIVPNNHHVTKLIITYEHERHLHAGPQATLTALRQRFWIVSAKSAIRQVLHRCVTCFKVDPIKVTPKMGNLPSQRVVQPSRAFLSTGVDYAGPITIRESRGRGKKKLLKSYIAIFVCFATKAVHIELVSDLSAESFLNAFRRFISRRGVPQEIFSDNGTNFIGAKNEIMEIVRFFKHSEFESNVINQLSNVGIKWHFIPPNSPHMGGLWEINVKSVKRHLKRTIGLVKLTFEEMYTVLVRIEACLNSRPLTSLSSNPNDLDVLTPGHFLIGEPLTAIPEYDINHISIHRLSRWQLVERIRVHFWKRWSQEYITQLQNRSKWQNNSTTVRKLEVGNMVLLVDDNTPPLMWKVGRIAELHPGDDQIPRVVTVRTVSGTFKRAARKVCVLPTD